METSKWIDRTMGQEAEQRCCEEQLRALRDGMDILGGKWKMLIMLYLYNKKDEANHFKKMQREITGISAKMLTKELRDLEVNFLITRTVQQDPIMVFYKISDYGYSAISITTDIMKWGLGHREKVKKAFNQA